MADSSKPLLGEILIQRKRITKEQLDEALEVQRSEGGVIGEVLIKLGFLEERDIVVALVVQCNIPYIALDKYDVDEDVVRLISREAALKYWAIPIDKVGDVLSVAMVNPLDAKGRDELQQITHCHVAPFIAMKAEVARAIERWF